MQKLAEEGRRQDTQQKCSQLIINYSTPVNCEDNRQGCQERSPMPRPCLLSSSSSSAAAAWNTVLVMHRVGIERSFYTDSRCVHGSGVNTAQQLR